jgi:aspartate dehydrogenase
MNETALYEFLETEHSEDSFSRSKSGNLIKRDAMKVGILGCGAIANVITDFALKGKLGVDLACFYDRDTKRAESIASKVGGTVALNLKDMLNLVDLVVEAASPQAVIETVPQILKNGKNVIIMSVGALLDLEFKNKLERIAIKNKSRIYTPSGAIVGLDGIKAASVGEITELNLVTRKPPESLGISINEEMVLYEGKASDAVRKFPQNMNVAAALSIACDKEADVKIIADPSVDHNIHDVHVVGDFGEFKTTTRNMSCTTNPKTSVLAAYSAIKLLKSLNDNLKIGT